MGLIDVLGRAVVTVEAFGALFAVVVYVFRSAVKP